MSELVPLMARHHPIALWGGRVVIARTWRRLAHNVAMLEELRNGERWRWCHSCVAWHALDSENTWHPARYTRPEATITSKPGGQGQE